MMLKAANPYSHVVNAERSVNLHTTGAAERGVWMVAGPTLGTREGRRGHCRLGEGRQTGEQQC